MDPEVEYRIKYLYKKLNTTYLLFILNIQNLRL